MLQRRSIFKSEVPSFDVGTGRGGADWIRVVMREQSLCMQVDDQSTAKTRSVAGSLEGVVNDGLGAGLNAGHVVSHGVHARLGRVDLDHLLKLSLAPGELVLPELALGLAFFDDERLGVLGVSDHLIDEVGFVDMWSQSRLVKNPAWGQPASDSSSHYFSSSLSNTY